MRRNVLLIPHPSLFEKKSRQHVGPFFWFGSETKWYSAYNERPQGEWEQSRWIDDVEINSEKADTKFSEPRVHCLEERSKAKEVENYLYISVPMEIQLKLFFAQLFLFISSVFAGAVSDLCEEYKSCHVRTGRFVLVRQYDLCARQQTLLTMAPTAFDRWSCARRSIAKVPRTRWTSCHNKNRVNRFCIDARIFDNVEVGQYFMTKDTAEFSQFNRVSGLS